LFREYDLTQGRWMTPDPAGMAAVDPTNPQSWNRYAYVNNNPLKATDPLGLDLDDCLSDDGCSDIDTCFGDYICPGVIAAEYEDKEFFDIIASMAWAAAFAPPPTPDQLPRHGGQWPNNETLGLPGGLNIHPLSLGDFFGLTPGGQCGDFLNCNAGPIVSQFTATAIPYPIVIDVTPIGQILTVLASTIFMQSDAAPCKVRGDCSDQECILTGSAKEPGGPGGVIKCFYSCPKPDGEESIKWQWGSNGHCPGFARENDLRSSLKRIERADHDLDARLDKTKKIGDQCNEFSSKN
jgi:hypothetical protein